MDLRLFGSANNVSGREAVAIGRTKAGVGASSRHKPSDVRVVGVG